jgi:hypothetical protein
MSSSRPLLIATLLTSLCWSYTAQSAEPTRALLDRGNKLFGSGDYQAAYDAFAAGYKQTPTPVFLRSMAFSLLKLFQHKKAQELLQEYSKRWPKAADVKNIGDILTGLEIVVQTRVKIDSEPQGAEVFFDTEASGKVGVTPYESTIDPGKHTVILQHAGFALTTRPFTIKPKETLPLKILLEVPIKVSSTPRGAALFIDEESQPSVGVTPFEGTIVPGKRTLIFKLAGYSPLRVDTVAKQGMAPVEAQLRIGLKVASLPPSASVEVDGQVIMGATPLEAQLLPGKHTVVIKLDQYLPHTQEVVVSPGQEVSVSAALKGGILTMRTVNVEKAKVRVGSYELGETPLDKATVPLGKQSVVVEHEGNPAWNQSIDFTADELVEAQVTMAGPRWPLWLSLGFTVGGLALGSTMGIIAKSKVSDDESSTTPCSITDSCSYSTHHVSTAAFITGGVAAAAGLLYYLIWGRPHQEIQRLPGTKTARLAR